MPKLALMPLILFAATISQAELYRWTDENGRVHFGDRAPDPEQHQSEQVDVEPPKPIGQGSDLRQINERLQQLRDQQAEEREAEAEYTEQREEARDSACRDALRHYNRMNRPFVYERDDGTIYEVSREQARADRAEVRAWIDANCPGIQLD